MFRQRLRIHFTKEGLFRYVGHHDLMRLVERAIRRAWLPLAYSAGYNPRPQISFPAALALGQESEDEVFEVELVRWTPPRRARESIERELPEGIGVSSVESVPFGQKARVSGARYEICLEEPGPDFAERLKEFMEKSEAFVQRLTKSKVRQVDARGPVKSARLRDGILELEIEFAHSGTVRPAEVVEAIIQAPPEALPRMRIKRTRLELAAPPQT
jgi:radical SAM-linked protein